MGLAHPRERKKASEIGGWGTRHDIRKDEDRELAWGRVWVYQPS